MARSWTWVALLGMLWVLGPLLGFCWSLPKAKESTGLPLRVMTWNVKFGTCDALARSAIIYDIERHNPGAVLLKDVGGLLDGPLKQEFKSNRPQP